MSAARSQGDNVPRGGFLADRVTHAHLHGGKRSQPDARGRSGDVVHRHPDLVIADIASAQLGVVTRAQLLAAGLTGRVIDRRLATGGLHVVFRGVYVAGLPHLRPFARQAAAQLACGPHSVLSHETAAWLWGMRRDEPADVDVLVVRPQRRRARPGLRVHTSAALVAHDAGVRHGLRVTVPARTLVDLAAVLRFADLRRAVEEARVARLTTTAQLTAALERCPHRAGLPGLRRILAEDRSPAFTRSEAERRLLDLLHRARLPQPRVNVGVAGHEVDLHWPASRLVVEVDGFAYHGSRAAIERDRRRDADLHAAGQRVLRVTWSQIADEPEALAARLALAIRS